MFVKVQKEKKSTVFSSTGKILMNELTMLPYYK